MADPLKSMLPTARTVTRPPEEVTEGPALRADQGVRARNTRVANLGWETIGSGSMAFDSRVRGRERMVTAA